MKRLTVVMSVAAAGLSLGLVATATAADLGRPAPYYAKAPIPTPFSWTGFYIGANAGYGWAKSNDDTTYTNNAATTDTGIGPGGAKGAFGGGEFGYNYQINNWFVVGAEADFEGAGLRNSPAAKLLSSGLILAETSQDVDWFYTVRGRAGFAVDRALVYFTGGYAGGKVADKSVLTDGIETATLTGGDSRHGYVLGGGLEYAFANNWSAKLEYQYINLGTETISGAAVPANGVTLSAPVKDQINTVRAGVNYHFGGW